MSKYLVGLGLLIGLILFAQSEKDAPHGVPKQSGVALAQPSPYSAAYIPSPDYVLSSVFPKIIRLGHGLVCATATASRGTMAAKSARRLKRYWTSAR